jgi:hypothetical protein
MDADPELNDTVRAIYADGAVRAANPNDPVSAYSLQLK